MPRLEERLGFKVGFGIRKRVERVLTRNRASGEGYFGERRVVLIEEVVERSRVILIVAGHQRRIDENEAFEHPWAAVKEERERGSTERMTEPDESALRIWRRSIVRRKKRWQPSGCSRRMRRFYGKVVFQELEHVTRVVGPADGVSENVAVDATCLTGMSAVKVPDLVNAVLATESLGLQLLNEGFNSWLKDLFVKAVGVTHNKRDAFPHVVAMLAGLWIEFEISGDDAIDGHPQLSLIGCSCLCDSLRVTGFQTAFAKSTQHLALSFVVFATTYLQPVIEVTFSASSLFRFRC